VRPDARRRRCHRRHLGMGLHRCAGERADYLQPQSAYCDLWEGIARKLDDFVHGGQFAAKGGHSSTAIAIVATYRPDESNDGLAASLRFTGEDGGRKLILTELFSRRIGHSASHCALPRRDRRPISQELSRRARPGATTHRDARMHGIPALDQRRPHLPVNARFRITSTVESLWTFRIHPAIYLRSNVDLLCDDL